MVIYTFSWVVPRDTTIPYVRVPASSVIVPSQVVVGTSYSPNPIEAAFIVALLLTLDNVNNKAPLAKSQNTNASVPPEL